MIQFILNNKDISTALPAGSLLLDFIRYHQHLTGTKIGCREGDCGACTVLVGEPTGAGMRYRSFTSCLTPLANVHGKHVLTVEGINPEAGLGPVQQAMAEAGATQCGFCTPGFVLSLTGFCLGENPPTPIQAAAAVDGNICRCTGYKSIERALEKIAALCRQRGKDQSSLDFAVEKGIVPPYLSGIRDRLLKLSSKANGVWNEAEKGAPFIGGGTDLFVQKPEALREGRNSYLFDQPGAKSIAEEGGICTIGPAATVTDLLESPLMKKYFPRLESYIRLVSSTPIRNMATLAGNFVNASPIGDFTIFFLALDARLVLSDGNRKRELPLRQLYKGYKSLDKKDNESLEQISFKLPGTGDLFHFEKVSKRTHLDIASVNTAIRLQMEGKKIGAAHLSAGGVAPVPLYLQKTSAFLSGQPVTSTLINKAIQLAQEEIAPIGDARGSETYKRLLLGQLIRAHFLTLFPQVQA